MEIFYRGCDDQLKTSVLRFIERSSAKDKAEKWRLLSAARPGASESCVVERKR
jgi:hypothetical protein